MAKQKPLAVYHSGSFKQDMRAYGCDRMSRDPIYRDAVHQAINERRAAERAAREAAKVADQ